MNKLLLILCYLLIGLQGVTQETNFSMDEAVQYAYRSQIQLKLAQVNIADAKAQIKETRAIGLPQINGTVDFNHFLKIPTSVIPASFFDPMAPDGEFAELQFGTKNNLTASATLSTLLFDGTFLVGLKAAKSSLNYSRAKYENVEQDIRANVKKAYLPPILIAENISTVQKNIDNLNKMYLEMKEMYKAGFIEQLDVDRLELSIGNLQMTLEDLKKNKTVTLNALKFQMGYPLDKEIVLTDIIDLEEINANELTLKTIDYSLRADYRVLENIKALNQLNVKRYKSGYLPSLSGFVTYQQVVQGSNLFDNPISSPTSIAGLKLNVPIFDSFRKSAQIQRAKLALEVVELNQDLLETGIDFNVQTAKYNYSNAKLKIQTRKNNVLLAQKIFDTSKIKYNEGVGSSIEIIQSEQSLYQSQQNYFTALYEYMIAKIDLEVALGL